LVQEGVLDPWSRPEHQQEQRLAGEPLRVLVHGDRITAVSDGQRGGRAQGQL
jgi:hypothetical protein